MRVQTYYSFTHSSSRMMYNPFTTKQRQCIQFNAGLGTWWWINPSHNHWRALVTNTVFLEWQHFWTCYMVYSMTVPLTELYHLVILSSLESYYNIQLFFKACGDKYLVLEPFCLWQVLPLAARCTTEVPAQTVVLCYCQKLHCCQVAQA